MAITIPPSVRTLDASTGKYLVQLSLGWNNATPQQFQIPGLPGFGGAFFGGFFTADKDIVNPLQLSVPIKLPPIKQIKGLIAFDTFDLVVGSSASPLIIQAVDTGDLVSIAPSMTVGGASGAQGSYVAGTPVAGAAQGAPRGNFVSFSVPIETNGGEIDFYKLEDLSPLGTHGYASIMLLTFNEAPYLFGA